MTDFLAHWNWDEFAVQAIASLFGAGIGAGIAAAVAFRVLKVERQERLADRAREDTARAKADADQLRAIRGEAIANLLTAVRPFIDTGQHPLPNRDVELAILRLLFDGTEDAYTVYTWTRHQFEVLPKDALLASAALTITFEVVRGMLVGWIRPEDEAGTIRSMKSSLSPS